MAGEKLCSFKNYIHCIDDKMLSKTRRKMNKKSYVGRWYGGASTDSPGVACSGSDSSAGPGESVKVQGTFLAELLSGVIPGTFTANALTSVQMNQKTIPQYRDAEEEQEVRKVDKIDIAKNIFASMINHPNATRQQIIDAIIQHAGVTQHTAVSYYERIAREAGITGQNYFGDEDDNDSEMVAGGGTSDQTADQPGQQDPNQAIVQQPQEFGDEIGDQENPEQQIPTSDDPNRQGIIRTVDNAHLVYKRQSPDGTFEELWIYNISPDFKQELETRRAILAGTDIPGQSTKSPDGSQSFTLTTLGNAQYLHITGLSG